MTPEGKSFAIMRLSAAPNLAALLRVWESLSTESQNAPDVAAHKEAIKKAMKEALNATPSTP